MGVVIVIGFLVLVAFAMSVPGTLKTKARRSSYLSTKTEMVARTSLSPSQVRTLARDCFTAARLRQTLDLSTKAIYRAPNGIEMDVTIAVDGPVTTLSVKPAHLVTTNGRVPKVTVVGEGIDRLTAAIHAEDPAAAITTR